MSVGMQNSLLHQFAEEWKIDKLSNISTTYIQTPPFSPIPGIDVSFCFHVWYKKNANNDREASDFKLTFSKLSGSDIPESLKMKIAVKVCYSDGSQYQQYVSPSFICVDNMTPITCVDVDSVLQKYGRGFTKSLHFQKMLSDALIVKCRLMFYGQLAMPGVESITRSSLSNLRTFSRDFASFYKSSVFSDIAIHIGGRIIPAHKAVLAAHSPVFLKMVSECFLESKTNSIVISDSKYEIFDNFLKYLYSGDVEDKSWSNVRELYTLADEYSVQSLKRECADIIVAFYLTTERVCEILKMSYTCDDEDLKNAGKLFAANHFEELVPTEEWNELVSTHPLIGYEVTTILWCAHKYAKQVSKQEEKRKREQDNKCVQDRKYEQDVKREQDMRREQNVKREQDAKRKQDVKYEQAVKRERDVKRKQYVNRRHDVKHEIIPIRVAADLILGLIFFIIICCYINYDKFELLLFKFLNE